MNAYEADARARKAAVLAKVLHQHGATPASVRALPANGRRLVEQLAGVHESSDATWAAVAILVEHFAQWADVG